MTQTPPSLTPIVGIGASAGGLDALKELFVALPDTNGYAFVVVQNLPANYRSRLGELLGQVTPLPVSEIVEGEPVQHHRVYLAPPDRDVALLHGVFHLIEPVAGNAPRRPIDHFFRSLARDQGEQATAVILSGAGSDGAAGAKAIGAAGGLVIAQSEESALYAGMPRAAMTTDWVDHVLAPRHMGHALTAQPRKQAEGPSRRRLDQLCAVVRDLTGRDLTVYRGAIVLRAVKKRLQTRDLDGLAAYILYVRRRPAEAGWLVDAVRIKRRSLLSDPSAWEALAQQALPPLLERLDAKTSIRAWVTECAGGEEAYTAAMVLVEATVAAGRTPNLVQVFATDGSEAAISNARSGVLPKATRPPAGPFARYFPLEGDRCRVSSALRDLMVFSVQDLFADPPLRHMDLIVCRNLLERLEKKGRRRLLERLHRSLAPGGVLLIGASDPIGECEGLFEAFVGDQPVLRRLDDTHVETAQYPEPRPAKGRSGPPADVSRVEQVLLERVAPPCVLVDRRGRVEYVAGDMAPFLRAPSGRLASDAAAIVKAALAPALRAGLRDARESNTKIVRERVTVETEQGPASVRVTVTPIDGPAAFDGHCLVVFDADKPNGSGGTPDTGDSTAKALAACEREVRALWEDHEAGIRRLRDANELQQKARDELESSNHELTAVNAELVHKVEVLSGVNDDIVNLFAATEIATLFLDRRLAIRRFTPSMQGLMHLVQADVGRPLSAFSVKLREDVVFSEALAVLDTLKPAEREVEGLDGTWYLMRVLPYRSREQIIDGVVVVFVDISARKEAEHALVASEERLREANVGLEQTVAERTEAARRANEQLCRAMEETIHALVLTMERHTPHTAGHQRRTARIARAIANELGLPEDRVSGVCMGAMVHDIGMIDLAEEMLNRRGPLNLREWEEVRGHAEQGFRILNDIPFPWPVAEMVRQHHERLDGSGYPAGLAGDAICLEARILAVAEAVEVMTSPHAYKPPRPLEEAIADLQAGSGIAYDKAVVDACVRGWEKGTLTV